MRYYIVSLGCPKNSVDAEDMCLLLGTEGHVQVLDPAQADVLLVNTCGFIESARQESLQVLNELARSKRRGQRLIAAGCLSQRAGAALARQVPGLDGVLGTRRWAEVLDVASRVSQRKSGQPVLACVGDPTHAAEAQDIPRTASLGASAYLKIADGCSAPCAFCAIPLIKGPLQSRAATDVIADARTLAQQGVREVILIAQDTTAYGHDRGEADVLPDLLQSLVDAVPEVPWIRIMYAYPQHISQTLIDTMAHHEQILPYLDLPLQHAHPDTLRRMRRPSNVDRVRRLIDDLRRAMPDIALRTSFIVGYPGETEREFRALESFLQEIAFDKVGVFGYSPEQDTPAFDLPNRVPAEVIEERYDRLMRLQQGISLSRNQAQVGRTLEVLVEGQGEITYEETEPPSSDSADAPAAISLGRSYRDAPEIDGFVLVDAPIAAGEMVSVRITGAMEYDLVGEIAP